MLNRFGVVKKKIAAAAKQFSRLAHLAILVTLLPLAARAADEDAQDPVVEARARLGSKLTTVKEGSLTLAPIDLAGGAKLTLISPREWTPIAERVTRDIKDAHEYFTRLFGEIPAFETSVQLMENKTFYALTGAPTWTNAMFYKGQIVIPLSRDEPIDYENIYRSVRHEFTHAVNAALTKNRCAGWLDEGLAQLEEGPENPLLFKALQDWSRRHQPVPFRLLQGGFTKLDTAMVPAAYAQSLVAANSMVKGFGHLKLRRYFDALREGADKAEAFRESFGISEAAFEQSVGKVIHELVHPHKEPH